MAIRRSRFLGWAVLILATLPVWTGCRPAHVRLQSVVPPSAPVELSCAVEPPEPFPGDPVTVVGTVLNLPPDLPTVYQWTSNAGAVAGKGSTARIDTRNAGSGTFEVRGIVRQGEQTAECRTSFTIRAYEPPAITCSSSPAVVMPGEASTITATALSPHDRPVTYSFAASGGQIVNNNGSNGATLMTESPGTITVICRAVDDKGQMAEASTAVTVLAPPTALSAVKPAASVGFTMSRNVAALSAQQKQAVESGVLSIARLESQYLAVIGSAGPGEPLSMAERRAHAGALFAIQQGIAPDRIVRFAMIAPTGAGLRFDTEPLDEMHMTMAGALTVNPENVAQEQGSNRSPASDGGGTSLTGGADSRETKPRSCAGYAMFVYPAFLDMSGWSRPAARFEMLAGTVAFEQELVHRLSDTTSACGTLEQCTRSIKSLCTAAATVRQQQIFAAGLRIWAFPRLPTYVKASVDGLQEDKPAAQQNVAIPTTGMRDLSQELGQWIWPGPLRDGTDSVTVSLGGFADPAGAAGADLIAPEAIPLQVKTGILSRVRGFWGWLVGVFSTLAGAMALWTKIGDAIVERLKKLIGLQKKDEPAAAGQKADGGTTYIVINNPSVSQETEANRARRPNDGREPRSGRPAHRRIERDGEP